MSEKWQKWRKSPRSPRKERSEGVQDPSSDLTQGTNLKKDRLRDREKKSPRKSAIKSRSPRPTRPPRLHRLPKTPEKKTSPRSSKEEKVSAGKYSKEFKTFIAVPDSAPPLVRKYALKVSKWYSGKDFGDLDLFPLSQKQGVHLKFLDGKISVEKFSRRVGEVLEKFRTLQESGFTYPLRISQLIASQLSTIISESEKKQGFPVKEYTKLLEYFRDEHSLNPRKGEGLWALPGQEEDKLFRKFILFRSTTSMEPKTIRSLGIKEIVGIKRRVVALFGGEFEYSAIVEYIRSQRDPERTPEEIKELILSRMNTAWKTLPLFFSKELVPPRDSLGVKRVPDYLEVGTPSASHKCRERKSSCRVQSLKTPKSPGGLVKSSVKSSRESKITVERAGDRGRDFSGDENRGCQPFKCNFFFNPLAMKKKTLLSVGSIVRHESVPGHFLERYHALSRYPKAKFGNLARGNPGYKEGWALYSEMLIPDPENAKSEKKRQRTELKEGESPGETRISKAYEKIRKDPYLFQVLGNLFSEMVRSVRMVVDTGINSSKFRMSFDEAEAFYTSNVLDSKEVVRNEILRCIVEPGKLSCYKIGQMEILRLRKEKAGIPRNSAKATPALKKFHSHVLFMPMPLEVLEEYIGEVYSETA